MRTDLSKVKLKLKPNFQGLVVCFDSFFLSHLFISFNLFVPSPPKHFLHSLHVSEACYVYSVSSKNTPPLHYHPLFQHACSDCVLCCLSLQVELIYYIFGRHKFPGAITANLERFVRRFNEVQYWVLTELCLCEDLVKRAVLLKKFIKMAAV